MESETEIDRSVDRIFSFINILKIITNTPKFQKWLKQYHEMENVDHLFTGYKFFIEVIFSDLLESIQLDSAFGLEEDFVYYRAQFVGVHIDDIPNSCEKIIFLKNIWNRSKKIRKAKNWDEIIYAIESIEDLLLTLDVIYEKYVYSSKELNKNDVTKIATIMVTHIFLNDTSAGRPHTYPTPILYPNYTVKYAEDAYEGYTYCLQYLWYILLGQEQFENSTIKELHNAHEKYLNQVNERVEEDQRVFGIYSDEKILPTLKKWLSLDCYFAVIKEEIIQSLMTNYRVNQILQLKNNFEKEELSFLLKKEGLKEPEYLTRDDSKDLKFKKLDYYFFWQEVNVLDSQNNTIFNGVPAFISTLIGRIEINRLFGNEDKVFVIKIKHTTDNFGDSECSYAILIENYGLLSDYSGWLVFYNCLVIDKDGEPYSLIDFQAEKIVKEYVESGEIQYNEITIDEDRFRQYLEERSVTSVFNTIKTRDELGNISEISLSKAKRNLDHFVGDVKGKFFEYLFYNWLSETNYNIYSRIICDLNRSGEQIDIFAENDEEIHIFECKVSLKKEKLKETLDQICKKRDLIKSDQKKVATCLVVYYPIEMSHRKKFELEGINVLHNFREEIVNWKKLNNDDKKKIVNNIFDYNFYDFL